MTGFHVYCLHGEFFCVCDSYKPLQYSKCARVDPVDAIQEDEISFQGSVHKGRGPPCSVSIGKSISLLEQVTCGHVLNPSPSTHQRKCRVNSKEMDGSLFSFTVTTLTKTFHIRTGKSPSLIR